MKQTALLEFESSAFAVIPGEDDETNPGIYGKALAQWLAEQLAAGGFSPHAVIAEDFGWCVPLESEPHSLYVACAGTGEKPGEWRVFAFVEGGRIARVLGKDTSAESLAFVFAALKHCLGSAPIIHGLREVA
jgi:hypothetical protein